VSADDAAVVAALIRPSVVEMVTAVRGADTAEARALIAANFVQTTFLPAVPRGDQPWALGTLIGCLAFHFAEMLDAVPDADEWFRQFALAIASDGASEDISGNAHE
jgi:hypothetical protein